MPVIVPKAKKKKSKRYHVVALPKTIPVETLPIVQEKTMTNLYCDATLEHVLDVFIT